jgi:hypothetical protein
MTKNLGDLFERRSLLEQLGGSGVAQAVCPDPFEARPVAR